jgi:hypothetical protein
MTKNQAISRIFTVIGTKNQTDNITQQALNLYDRLVKSRFRKALPAITEDRKKGEWTRKTDELNDME